MIGHGRMLAVGLVAALGWSAPAAAQDFCGTLKSLVSLAKEDFASLKGEPTPQPSSMHYGTITPPGFGRCTVSERREISLPAPGRPDQKELRPATYRCPFSVTDADTAFVKMVEQVAACFGYRYTLTPRETGYGDAALEIVSDQAGMRAHQGFEIKDRPDYLATIELQKREGKVVYLNVAKQKNPNNR